MIKEIFLLQKFGPKVRYSKHEQPDVSYILSATIIMCLFENMNKTEVIFPKGMVRSLLE